MAYDRNRGFLNGHLPPFLVLKKVIYSMRIERRTKALGQAIALVHCPSLSILSGPGDIFCNPIVSGLECFDSFGTTNLGCS
jgi:hypothetical protein